MTEKETARIDRPGPEVKPAAPHRHFSAREKLRIWKKRMRAQNRARWVRWCGEKEYTRRI